MLEAILLGLSFIILGYPTCPVSCDKRGCSCDSGLGLFSVVNYCESCQEALTLEEKEKFESSSKLALSALRDVLTRKIQRIKLENKV